MKIAAISELKAKLASYIRLVKSGEEVEIREHGVPVARLVAVKKESPIAIVSPSKNPSSLAKFRFSVKPKAKFDVLDLILEDRSKR